MALDQLRGYGMVVDARAELVRVSLVAQLASRIEAAGYAGTTLLKSFGVTRNLVDDPYALLPLASYVGLFEAAAAFLGDPALGFRLGREIEPASLGPMGYLVLTQRPGADD